MKTDAKADKLLITDKMLVVPGQELAFGLGFIPGANTYRLNDVVRAGRLGLASVEGKVIKLVPLSGPYAPKLHDRVIGRVVDVLLTGWRLELNGPYSAVLSLKEATVSFVPRGADLTQFFALGDVVVAKITNVTSQKLIDVTMRGPGLQKLPGGRVISVNPQKVPRIVGKDASMLNLIRDATGCQIVVGQNGLVWIDGPVAEQLIVVEVIRRIQEESHVPGLTERVGAFLKSKCKPRSVTRVVGKTEGFDRSGRGERDSDSAHGESENMSEEQMNGSDDDGV